MSSSLLRRIPFFFPSLIRPSSTVSIPVSLYDPNSSTTQKTWTVSRTKSLGIPVYYRVDRASKAKETVIRRIEGSSNALRDEIVKEKVCGEDAEVIINPVTKHIIIKGPHQGTIKAWLASKGV